MTIRFTLHTLAGVLALGVGTASAAGPEGKPVDPTRPAATRTNPPAEPTPGTTTPGTTAPGTTGTPGSVVNDTARAPERSPAGTGEVPGTTGQPPGAPSAGTTVDTATGTAALSPAESRSAKQVLTEIHKVNTKEIALGRLAQTKAESQAVKDYAQQLVSDHESADKKVMDFATSKNIMLATTVGTVREQPTTATDVGVRTGTGTTGTATATTGTGAGVATGSTTASATDANAGADQLDPEGRRVYSKLDKLEGPKFEKAFLTEMVRGHSKTLAKVKGAEKRAQNAELKLLLGDISGSVQMHLDKAKELQRGGSASLEVPGPAQASAR